MAAEHRRPDGTLSPGYYCGRCGKVTNLVGTGHGLNKCENNLGLVIQLHAANPRDGSKPRYSIPGIVKK